jgi:poly [ADP-ribose] polymerase
LALQ